MQFQRILLVAAFVIGFLAILWMCVALLFTQRIPNTLGFPQRGQEYSFDYVIVGSGTCGSVVASLLAQHGNGTVLVIEAGAEFGFLSKIPLLSTFQQKGINDWGFYSVPQRHSSRGLIEQRQCLPRGKGIGGSAQMNFMLHFEAGEVDFERWALEYNLSEWRWELVHPYLEASKTKSADLLALDVKYSKLMESLELASKEFAHKSWRFRRAVYTIKKGLRHGVLQRFLLPALEKYRNLYLMPNAMARRVILNANKEVSTLQVGIKVDGKEKIIPIEIRRELIISAGAYQSPQILLASGIGNAKELQKLKIPCQYNLPMVGKHLHDHFNQPLFVSMDVVGPTLNQRSLLDPISIFNYLTAGTGHLGNFGVLGQLFAEKFGLTFFAAGAIDESALMSISNYKRDHFRALFPRYHNSTQEGFVAISACLQPKSRGNVGIISANTRLPPLIDPNYLSVKDDVTCTIEAIRTVVEVVNSKAFETLKPRIHWPKIRECSKYGPFEADFLSDRPSDEYLECVMRHVGLTSHHPGGSCRMGTDENNSVTDAQFRVHGIKKLRVIDASVLPTPISGNPNSVLVAMAVRGVTFILKNILNEECK